MRPSHFYNLRPHQWREKEEKPLWTWFFNLQQDTAAVAELRPQGRNRYCSLPSWPWLLIIFSPSLTVTLGSGKRTGSAWSDCCGQSSPPPTGQRCGRGSVRSRSQSLRRWRHNASVQWRSAQKTSGYVRPCDCGPPIQKCEIPYAKKQVGPQTSWCLLHTLNVILIQ
jgi:hypothetical protein